MSTILMAGVPTIAGAEAAEPAVDCRNFASLYSADEDGRLYERSHSRPTEGQGFWDSAIGSIGSGVTGNMLAGTDGLMYQIKPDGIVEAYRHIGGRSWYQWEDGSYSRNISTTLGGYTDPVWRKRITVDSNGTFYLIRGNNQLYRATVDIEGLEFRQQSIAEDWSRFDAITAAGPGVLYARESDGTLYRFHYEESSQRWIDEGTHVDDGWDRYTAFVSPGADILYAVDTESGGVYWHRFFPYSEETVEPRLMVVAGTHDYRVAMPSDSCAWIPPTEDTTPESGAATKPGSTEGA